MNIGAWIKSLNSPVVQGNTKGAFGINGNSIAGQGIGAIGPAVGQLGDAIIGQGLESGVGSAITNVGGVIGSAVSSINPVLGGALSAVSGLVGGLTKTAFGSKLNKENISRIDSDNDAMNLLYVDDSSTDSVANAFRNIDYGQDFSRRDVGRDGWFSNKAKNKYKELSAQRAAAINRANSTLFNAQENADTLMDQRIMANFRAGGGPLHSINLFSPGGFLSTQGSDFSAGLTRINQGGSHEQNPYGGIQVGTDDKGTPNLVEEGEIIWDDYVFSNRIKVPKKIRQRYKLGNKKDMTFADAVKHISKESEERPLDPISANGLVNYLENLRQEQETIRQAMKAKQLAAQMKSLPDQEKEQVLQQLLQGEQQEAQQQNNGNQGMGIPGILPTMQAYGGPKPNLFSNGGDEDNVNHDQEVELMNDLDWWYNAGVRHIYNNWDDPRVQNWYENTFYPALKENYDKLGLDMPDDIDAQMYFDQSFSEDYAQNNPWFQGNMYADELLELTDDQSFTGNFKPNLTEPTQEEEIEPVVASVEDDDLEFKPIRKDVYFKDGMWHDFALDEVPEFYEGLGENNQTWQENYANGYKLLKKGEPVRSNAGDTTTYYWVPDDYDEGIGGRSYPTWLRYAEPIGQAGLVLTDALGITNKDDTSDIDNALRSVNNIYRPLSFNPIGDYRRYRPLDRDYYLNRLNQNAASVRRDIMNTSGGNSNKAIAGLLAAGYNAQQSAADALMKMDLANREEEAKVAEFNRATNQFNATGRFEAEKANQAAWNTARALRINQAMEAAKLRQAIKQQGAQQRGLNITGLLSSLGQLGLEAQNRKDRDMLVAKNVFKGLGAGDLVDMLGKEQALQTLIGRGLTEADAKKLIGI